MPTELRRSRPPKAARKYSANGSIVPNVHPRKGRTDRELGLKAKPGKKPPEEQMSIAANRVALVNKATNTYHRFESLMEADAATILMARDPGVKIQAQYGWVEFKRDGIIRRHMFDILASFSNGCRTLFSVRIAKKTKDLKVDLELMRNQVLHKHAHKIVLLTEEQITKPVVYQAREILRAREMMNERNVTYAYEAIKAMGGRARVFDVMRSIPDVPLSVAWYAIWNLIDQKYIVHDHPEANDTYLDRISWIRTAEAA